MFEYGFKVNKSYSVVFFVPDKTTKTYKIIYKKRLWIIFKNKIKTFFNNFVFRIKFFKLIRISRKTKKRAIIIE